MKRFRLKIAEPDFEELRQLVLADMPKEAGAFALAGLAVSGHTTDILVRRAIAIPKGMFSLQHEYRLEVASQAINGLASLCESNGLGAVICHSHPSDIPYSPTDEEGELRIVEALRAFIPRGAPTASLLFHPNGVSGRVWLPDTAQPVRLSEIIVVGRFMRRIGSPTPKERDETSFDREVRAFGAEGVSRIRRAKAAIVGTGGTGSPIAEQLVRLGVTDLVLIDPDRLEMSNLTRVYGTYVSDLTPRWWSFRRSDPYKVRLIKRHLLSVRPHTTVRAVPTSVVIESAASALLDRDVIFLCTDEHWGRSIVNQVSYQYLIPTINLGMSVRAKEGKISGAVGVVDVLRPGLPCLWCRQFLRADRIAAESMPRKDREARAREGYVDGVETAPSVVSVTTTIAGLAVTQFLQLLTDFMGPAGEVARLNYNVMDGTVRRGTSTILDRCICKKTKAFGDLKRLPVLANVPN